MGRSIRSAVGAGRDDHRTRAEIACTRVHPQAGGPTHNRRDLHAFADRGWKLAAYRSRYATIASRGRYPSGSGPSYVPPGNRMNQFGVTRQKLFQRVRQDCPIRSRSSTTWSIPRRASSELAASPACPAPMMTTSTVSAIPSTSKITKDRRDPSPTPSRPYSCGHSDPSRILLIISIPCFRVATSCWAAMVSAGLSDRSLFALGGPRADREGGPRGCGDDSRHEEDPMPRRRPRHRPLSAGVTPSPRPPMSSLGATSRGRGRTQGRLRANRSWMVSRASMRRRRGTTRCFRGLAGRDGGRTRRRSTTAMPPSPAAPNSRPRRAPKRGAPPPRLDWRWASPSRSAIRRADDPRRDVPRGRALEDLDEGHG